MQACNTNIREEGDRAHLTSVVAVVLPLQRAEELLLESFKFSEVVQQRGALFVHDNAALTNCHLGQVAEGFGGLLHGWRRR